MPRRTIVYRWILGPGSVGLALVLVLPSAVALAIHQEGVSARSGYQLVDDGYLITTAVLILAGGIFAVGGVVAQLVA
jgi:hypothetical protein